MDSGTASQSRPKDLVGVGKKVSFSTLEIRENDVVLGSNPLVRDGPPVELGENEQTRVIVDLDTYEKLRQPRRSTCELVMSSLDRENL
jgi:hypothetical protein